MGLKDFLKKGFGTTATTTAPATPAVDSTKIQNVSLNEPELPEPMLVPFIDEKVWEQLTEVEKETLKVNILLNLLAELKKR